jgi:hypothetical protein
MLIRNKMQFLLPLVQHTVLLLIKAEALNDTQFSGRLRNSIVSVLPGSMIISSTSVHFNINNHKISSYQNKNRV